jgi:hypothetical protein
MLTFIRYAIIDKLQSQTPKMGGLIFVFINYKERETQKLTDIIASLVQQLVILSNAIPKEVGAMHKKHTSNRTRPGVKELSELLNLLIEKFPVIYLVVDALDECSQEMKDRFITILRELLDKARLLCTSRPLGYIEEALVGSSRLEVRASDSDIQRYVAAQIKLTLRLQRYSRIREDLQGSITEKSFERAQGIFVSPCVVWIAIAYLVSFLLTQFHMKSLESKTNIASLRKALKSLPSNIDTMYVQAMERIQDLPADESTLALRILSWITHAVPPLKVEEIQHAIAVMKLVPGESSIGFEYLTDEAELINVCGGIVIIEEESRLIRLAHYTTQEYFEG